MGFKIDTVRLISMLLLLSTLTFGQDVRLSGKVVDAKSDEPLVGADVYLKNLKVGTTTDRDGLFLLSASTDLSGDTLMVSFVGYQAFRQAVSTFRNRSTIKLTPMVIQQDSIVVRGERIDIVRQEIPHARSTVTFEEIETRGISEISDIFKIVPSVRVEGNDISGRQIQIRGSNSDEVNVYVDGILINNLGLDNAADLSIVPTENIETIEVLSGANLALLGHGAFGGVVNVKTKKSLDRSLFLKTKQGSFETQYYIGEINYPLRDNVVLNYFGQFNGVKPGIEYFPGEARDEEKSENDAVETSKQNHNVSLDYYSKKGQLSARFYGYFLDYEKLSIDNNPFQNQRDNMLFTGSYTGSLLGLNDFDLRVNYLKGKDERRRDRVSSVGVGNVFRDLYDVNNLAVRFLKKFEMKKDNEIQLLAEYFHDELESDVKFDINGVESSVYNALLYENRWSVAGVAAFSDQIPNSNVQWKTHLGMRGDFVATGDNYVSPTAGFQVEFREPEWSVAPYANYGKNVKFHSLLSNAYDALQDISADDTTLIRLKPEESNAGEIGVEYRKYRDESNTVAMEAKLALFRRTVFNKLVTIQNFASQVFTQAQVGRNVTQGVEASVRFNSVLSNLDLLGSATLLDVEQLSLYPFKPETMYSIQGIYSGRWGGYITSTLFYEGKSKALLEDDTGTGVIEENIDPFFDVDFSVGYRFRLSGIRFNLQAAGYNVLDNSGFQFYLLKKQFFQVSLSARL